MPALEVIGVVGQAGSYEAYAAAVPSADRVSLIDAAASDEVSARGLIAALAVAYEGRPLRLIDEPAESPVAAALGHAGMTPFLSQVEMVRRVV